MSVRVIDRVWRSGRYSGGTLLILLAMADWASDDGSRVFPTTRQLAVKSRMTERQVRTCTRQLENDGVIVMVNAATGRPGQANEFRIVLKELQPIEEPEHLTTQSGGDGGKNFTPEIHVKDGGNLEQGGRKSTTGTAEICDRHIDKPLSEPLSQPSSEPSGAPPPSAGVSPAAAAPQDSLPGFDPPKPEPPKPKAGKGKKANPNRIEDQAVLTAAIDAYNAAAVRLGWAECMNPHEERQRRLGARLVEGGGIDGWKVALEKAEASDFLMGRTPAREGHKQFRLDIDFLLQVSSFTRLMEGFYDNRNRNAGAGASLSPIRAAARAVAEGLDR